MTTYDNLTQTTFDGHSSKGHRLSQMPIIDDISEASSQNTSLSSSTLTIPSKSYTYSYSRLSPSYNRPNSIPKIEESNFTDNGEVEESDEEEYDNDNSFFALDDSDEDSAK